MAFNGPEEKAMRQQIFERKEIVAPVQITSLDELAGVTTPEEMADILGMLEPDPSPPGGAIEVHSYEVDGNGSLETKKMDVLFWPRMP